ncbi:MAG TPA: alcohol dehydrogenase catalytic domain-containing protein, partial [Bryobacteraceae bacterium]
MRLIEREEPNVRTPFDVKLRVLEVGVCGTDRELCGFVHGSPPPGSDHFILGHESLAEVIETGREVNAFKSGDVVVAGVRLPC